MLYTGTVPIDLKINGCKTAGVCDKWLVGSEIHSQNLNWAQK